MITNEAMVELKASTIVGMIEKIEGSNVYITSGNDTLKFHVDEVEIVPNNNRKQWVKVDGKIVQRVVTKNKLGDRFITYNNEKFMLEWYKNQIQTVITTNTASCLWELQHSVDARMHHQDKLSENTLYFMRLRYNQLIREYARNREFLDRYYEVDSYALQEWIDYAEGIIKEVA